MINPSERELKPCPFCSSPAEFHKMDCISGEFPPHIWIDCLQCGCSKGGGISPARKIFSDNEVQEAINALIKTWNTRTEDKYVPMLVEVLKDLQVILPTLIPEYDSTETKLRIKEVLAELPDDILNSTTKEDL